MRKLNLSQSKKNPNFYQVLQVLFYFIDDESKNEGDTMNRTKKIIAQLAADLGNLALLNNWYDISKIDKSKLKSLVNFDENSGFSPKNNL